MVPSGLWENVILTKFCLKNIHFIFQGMCYEAAKGSPIRCMVATMFVEEFEITVINSATHPPRLWLRYVDDTFVIQKAEHSSHFLQHINSIDPHIQFTQETPDTEGSIPFLGTLVSAESENTLVITVYREPSHTYQCWNLDSQHHLPIRWSVFNTLTHKARTSCASLWLLHKEENT